MSDGKHAGPNRIESLHVKGFRSFADLRLDDIPNPMVLLGPNGAGKSNILRFLQMLGALAHCGLGEFVRRQGGADGQLFGGSQRSERIEAKVFSRTDQGSHAYAVTLERTGEDEFAFANEEFTPWHADGRAGLNWGPQRGGRESTFVPMADSKASDNRARAAVNLMRDAMVYQFHDTSSASPLKMRWDAEDNHRLHEHGGNLAPILIHLRQEHVSTCELICRHIRRVLPDFRCFEIERNDGKMRLGWRTIATDQTIRADRTSDGSLRAFCLIALLNLPDEMLPSIVVLDEPELGLHPFAVSLVSHMVKAMARERQVIVATQSPYFVDAFGLDEIVVLETHDGRTKASRPRETFKDWLDEQTTGELWWSNLLGGYP